MNCRINLTMDQLSGRWTVEYIFSVSQFYRWCSSSSWLASCLSIRNNLNRSRKNRLDWQTLWNITSGSKLALCWKVHASIQLAWMTSLWTQMPANMRQRCRMNSWILKMDHMSCLWETAVEHWQNLDKLLTWKRKSIWLHSISIKTVFKILTTWHFG